ncbi:hypothetical protein EZS27_025110, partial [termite gut metagenome]
MNRIRGRRETSGKHKKQCGIRLLSRFLRIFVFINTVRMKRNSQSIYYLLSLLFVISCQNDYPEYEKGEDKTTATPTLPPEEYWEGWVRVKFHREAGDNIQLITTPSGTTRTKVSQVDELMNRLEATKIERVFAEGGKFRERRREAGLHLWYDIYTGDSQNHARTRAVETLGDSPLVDVAEL